MYGDDNSLLSLPAALRGSAPMPIQPGHTLVPRVSFVDALGRKHTRLMHYYHGVRVWDFYPRRVLSRCPMATAAASAASEGSWTLRLSSTITIFPTWVLSAQP